MHNFFFRQSPLINNALPSFIALFFETLHDVLLVPYRRKRKKKIWNYVGITESEKLEGGLEKTTRFSGST